MKTIFVINPCAGRENSVKFLLDKVKNLIETECEVYITESVGDATEFVKNYCENNGPARFIACGGDGTFSEVLNGAISYPEAETGIIPMGTGNDFCRNFEDNTLIFDAKAQSSGKSVKCDAIRYTTTTKSGKITGYCANMFNIGFDCNVADMTARMKKNSLISGSVAYLLSIFAMLISKKGANLKIEVDGKERYNGKLLLTSIANGCYCGGGIKSNPLASIRDGKININIVKNVPRYKFLYLLPFYMKGTYLNLKNIDKIIISEKCSEIKITPIGGNMRLCIDGEIIDAGETVFEICPRLFNFVIPCLPDESKEKTLV